MPFDVMSFAVAKVEAEKHGLSNPAEANRVAVIGSLMSSPLLALVVARSMSGQQTTAAPASATTTLAPVDAPAQLPGNGQDKPHTHDKPHDPDQTQGQTQGPAQAHTHGPNDGHVHNDACPEVLSEVESAREAAEAATNAVEATRAELRELGQRLATALAAIEKQLAGAPSKR